MESCNSSSSASAIVTAPCHENRMPAVPMLSPNSNPHPKRMLLAHKHK